MSGALKKNLEVWRVVSNSDLAKGLRVYPLGAQVGSVRKEKGRFLIVKSAFLRIGNPAFLAVALVQDRYQQVSGSEDDGTRWSGSGAVRGFVPWRPGVCPGAHPGVDVGRESSRSLSSQVS